MSVLAAYKQSLIIGPSSCYYTCQNCGIILHDRYKWSIFWTACSSCADILGSQRQSFVESLTRNLRSLEKKLSAKKYHKMIAEAKRLKVDLYPWAKRIKALKLLIPFAEVHDS